jgi:hypothetical protein
MMIFGWNRVKGFKIMATFLGVILRFNKWKEHRKFLPSNLEELESAKSGWEIAAKVPQFALELWKGQLESQIEYLSFQRAGRVLSEEELSVIETTAARAKGAEVGIRFLTGPIGFILGALDVVLETHNSIESAEAGDSGAMWGHAVIAAGALLGLAPSVALLSGAEAVAWAGPVGLVAAIIMAGGAIIVAKCSKNDLQMFAMHCFLGNEYGHGQFKETEKPWMAETSWPGLRYVPGSKKESDDRFLLQRTALLRLLCNYSTRVVSDHHSGSCYIYPRLIPDGGIFEVSVEFRQFLSPKTCPVEVYKASILPGQEKFQWTGTIPPYGSGITFTRETNGRDIKWVNVKIVAKAQTEVDTVFRTRLLLDPAGEFTVPAKDWVADHS